MKINKIKLASDEADLNIHDFVDGATHTRRNQRRSLSLYVRD